MQMYNKISNSQKSMLKFTKILKGYGIAMRQTAFLYTNWSSLYFGGLKRSGIADP